jgi:hypothetical protein
MAVAGVVTFERFFRETAALDLDKDDLRRHREFIIRKLNDLLVRGQAVAKANRRDIIEPFDLPITKGLQERIQEFRKTEEAAALEPLLGEMASHRSIDLKLSDQTEARLADVAGGLSAALAHAFRIIDPKLKNPQTEQWERAVRLFDLLV